MIATITTIEMEATIPAIAPPDKPLDEFETKMVVVAGEADVGPPETVEVWNFNQYKMRYQQTDVAEVVDPPPETSAPNEVGTVTLFLVSVYSVFGNTEVALPQLMRCHYRE